jgi:hypothetical protein
MGMVRYYWNYHVSPHSLLLASGYPMGFRALSERVDAVEANLQHRSDIHEYNQRKLLLLLTALCEEKGIDPSTVPGFNDPPPQRRSLSPMSPSLQSASSTGVGMSSLALSDARSDASAPSVTTSNVSCEYLNTLVYPLSHYIP